jgi:hypothetical protein
MTRARIPAALALLLIPTSPSLAGDAPPVLTHGAAGLVATMTVAGADGSAPRAGEVSLLQLAFAAEGGGPARGLRPAAYTFYAKASAPCNDIRIQAYSALLFRFCCINNPDSNSRV